VPITTNVDREYTTDVPLTGLDLSSIAQCHLATTISANQVLRDDGNFGPLILPQIRSLLADLFDIG